ncbi:MAG: DUF4870 domain-containing protein [Acidobacteriaceae bacterium]
MLCPSCRQESSGSFCNFCGATLAAAPAGAGATAIPSTSAGAGLSPNAAAAISYLTIIPSIIFLVLDPYKDMKLVKFHSIQNIALTVAMVAIFIALGILSAIVGTVVPIIGGLIFLFLDFAVGVAFFVAWLLAIIKASKGEYFKLPFIGAFSAKQAGV